MGHYIIIELEMELLLDLDALVAANENGISINSGLAQCLRRINGQLFRNGKARHDVGVVFDPKSADKWIAR